MKMISWNVNGIRACVGKNFMDFFKEADADIFCIQESKMQEGQLQLELPGYYQYWNYAEKKGYSGTAIFAKKEPLSVAYGIGIEEHDHEGRVITLEYDNFYMVTVYTPNSQNEPKTNRKNAGFTDEERENSVPCLTVDLLIRFVFLIRTQKAFIPGGLTVLRQERRMPDGGSTIF